MTNPTGDSPASHEGTWPEPNEAPAAPSLRQAGILAAIAMIAENVDRVLKDHVRMDTVTPEEIAR